MQARWLALVLVASVAHAEPTLRLGAANMHATIERASVAFERAAAAERPWSAASGATIVGSRATIALKLATDSRERGEAQLGIDLPAGSRVVGLVMLHGGRRMLGRRVDVDEANARYRAWQERRSDPALLEWVASDGERDRLRLRVFPIERYHAASIEIAIELPAISHVVVDPDGVPMTISSGQQAWAGSLTPRTLAVAHAHAPAADALVDATHALYADDDRPPRWAPPSPKLVAPSFCGWPTR